MSVPFERSAGLGVHHGFFGRAGGMSQGEFAGANMSTSVGDDPEAVAANRRSAADALGFSSGLQLLKQVHSADVLALTEPLSQPGTIAADALVTDRPGLLLAILTADCTPILLADQEAGVIGAAHAGWRGAVDGVVGNTVAAMRKLGADPARVVAAIGPTITQPNYEVGEQFRADFLALHPAGERFFTTPPGKRAHFDLPGFVEDQLRRAGVGTIERVGGCTYAHPDRYFSHRYATHQGTRTGRQVSVIGLT
ncbi:peptidoglycan editing factor PgeF [Devosia albogilva]|uniref:Purine nucleoside phosphorylase n=1 Tax=Devosia albogilva TaxID=429726 RepID=A0ABW5QGQ4_9HYPH